MAFLSSSLLITIFVSALPLLCLSSSSNNLLFLSVENPEHVIKARNGNFTAGFYNVGENAYAFAIWFTESQGQSLTVIWMANRDVLVNGKGSTLTLRRDGNLVLNDAGQLDVWSTNTTSLKPPQLILKDDGNLNPLIILFCGKVLIFRQTHLFLDRGLPDTLALSPPKVRLIPLLAFISYFLTMIMFFVLSTMALSYRVFTGHLHGFNHGKLSGPHSMQVALCFLMRMAISFQLITLLVRHQTMACWKTDSKFDPTDSIEE